MIANEENPVRIHEATPEEEALLESSSAPTVRDLREWADGLLTIIEPDPASPKQED